LRTPMQVDLFHDLKLDFCGPVARRMTNGRLAALDGRVHLPIQRPERSVGRGAPNRDDAAVRQWPRASVSCPAASSSAHSASTRATGRPSHVATPSASALPCAASATSTSRWRLVTGAVLALVAVREPGPVGR